MLALTIAVGLPIVLLQFYKAFVGPISFGIQLVVVLIISVLAGIVLYIAYRSSARNQP